MSDDIFDNSNGQSLGSNPNDVFSIADLEKALNKMKQIDLKCPTVCRWCLEEVHASDWDTHPCNKFEGTL